MFQAWFSSFASAPHRIPCGETEQRYRIPARYATRPHRRFCRTPVPLSSVCPLLRRPKKRVRPLAHSPLLPHAGRHTRLYTPCSAAAEKRTPPCPLATMPAPAQMRLHLIHPRQPILARSVRSASPPPQQPSPPNRPCLLSPILPRRSAPVPTAESFLPFPAAVPTNAPYSAPSRHPATPTQKKFPFRRQGRNGNRIARGKCALVRTTPTRSWQAVWTRYRTRRG